MATSPGSFDDRESFRVAEAVLGVVRERRPEFADDEAVWEAFGGKTCIIPHCSTEIIVASFKNAHEWVEHVLKTKTHNQGLALMVMPVVGDAHQVSLDVALGRKARIDWKEVLLFGRDIRKLIKRYS